MPVVPNNGKLFIELDRPDSVAELVEAARSLDPADVASGLTSARRTVSDIGDHLLFLSIVKPEWFAPFRDEAVTDLHSRLGLDLGSAAVLLQGTSEGATRQVVQRLADDPTRWQELELLAGIGSELALGELANHVRRYPSEAEWVNRLGVHVGATGPAVWRFTPERCSLHATDDAGSAAGHRGLPTNEVADCDGIVSWHYLSFRLDVVAGMAPWPHPFLHIVSPRKDVFTLRAAVANDGRYINCAVEGAPDADSGYWAQFDDEVPPRDAIAIRPYDADIVVRNGTAQLTPGFLGTVGGPPIGMYPNPVCGGCDVLMFHGATTDSNVREYGDGFRSVFYCTDCVRVAVSGTGWN